MKRVLVIDDVRVFDIPDADITYARTVEQARVCLEQEWDEVWWDHDMGLYQFNGTDFARLSNLEIDRLMEDTTTYPLALEIEEGIVEIKSQNVFVHSANPDGAMRLMEALSEYEPTRVPTASAPLARVWMNPYYAEVWEGWD